MVFAALASFAVLLIAWVMAPGEGRRREVSHPAGQPLATAAWPRG
jgi:hypothetical protein